MSRWITGENGTCPCRNCQRHLRRTPAQRAVIKNLKTGKNLPRWAMRTGLFDDPDQTVWDYLNKVEPGSPEEEAA